MNNQADREKAEDLTACRTTDTAEHSRFSDMGEPCDDARSADSVTAKNLEKEQPLMNKTTLMIPNISCGHCLMTIKNELSDIEGVTNVSGQAESKRIEVHWTAPATLEKIKEKLDDINYPAA
jgi:copper chaperone